MADDDVNRAYYSFFHAAKAMLNVLGFNAKTHSGLISEFGLRIIKPNLLDKKFGEYFRRAFEMRESSDYEIGIIFGEDEVQTLIKNAEDFLKKARVHREKTSNLSNHQNFKLFLLSRWWSCFLQFLLRRFLQLL